jgi:hypothetical protein
MIFLVISLFSREKIWVDFVLCSFFHGNPTLFIPSISVFLSFFGTVPAFAKKRRGRFLTDFIRKEEDEEVE